MSKRVPVNVMMLVNSADTQSVAMTKAAIDSLHASETEFSFNCWVIETNPQAQDYVGAISIRPNEPFNYNRYLNIGLQEIRKKHYHDSANDLVAYDRRNDLDSSEYIVVVNNDVLFGEGWFSAIKQAMDNCNLDSASPVSPGWDPHLQYQHVSNAPAVVGGFDIGHQFCGWCIVFKTEAYNKLYPFPEQLKFWMQDNFCALHMQKLGTQHALVLNSHVTHLVSQSHRLIPPGEGFSWTHGMAEEFGKVVAEYDEKGKW